METHLGFQATGNLPIERCPYCGVAHPTIKHVHSIPTHNHAGMHIRQIHLYYCTSCGGGIVANSGRNNLVHSYYPSGDQRLDDSIPSRPRQFLDEARRALATPGLSIIGSARAVDAMLQERGIEGRTPNEKINAAQEKGILLPDMAAWAHDVRLDSNDERHPEKNVKPLDAEAAKKCLDFAMTLAELLFVLPARVKGGREKAAQGPESGSKPAS